MGSRLHTYECNIVGASPNQFMHLSSDGDLIYRDGDGQVKSSRLRTMNGGGCIAPESPSMGKAIYVGVQGCTTYVDEVRKSSWLSSNVVTDAEGGTAPQSFRLRSRQDKGACAVASGSSSADGP